MIEQARDIAVLPAIIIVGILVYVIAVSLFVTAVIPLTLLSRCFALLADSEKDK